MRFDCRPQDHGDLLPAGKRETEPSYHCRSTAQTKHDPIRRETVVRHELFGQTGERCGGGVRRESGLGEAV